MQKRKRNSVTPTPSKNPPNTRASTGRAVPVKSQLNQRENAGKIEAIEIDLTDDDSERFPGTERQGASLPKKKKMEENIRGSGACTRAATLNQPKPLKQPSSNDQSSSKAAQDSWENALSNGSNHAISNGNAKYSTAPDVPPPHIFKMPNPAPPILPKVSMPPPPIQGPSSVQLPRPSSFGKRIGNVSTTQVRKPTKKRPTEKELKATEESRRLRIAIVEAFQDELEKASNGELNDINIDDLVCNLRTCIKMWPNIYVTERYPQVQESDDRSHNWEIVEFSRWWLFGLTGLFFASPAMSKPTVRENIKMLIRTLCQYLCNGHPTLIEAFVPQLLCILRDLTVVGGGGGNLTTTIRIHLPFTKMEENSKKRTKTNSNYEVQITGSNEWAIPHYLEAISILFPRIFFYNHQLRHVLLELLKRLSTRLSPASFGHVVMSTLHNALMPLMGYLTEKAVGEMICEMVKATSRLEDFCRQLLNHREIGSLAALSGRDGTTMVAVESSDFLCSPDFAMLYNDDANLPLRTSFEFLFNEIFKRNAALSTDMIRVSTMMSVRSSSTMNVVLHPLVENVIVRELLTVTRPPSVRPLQQISNHQSLLTKARDVSELWSRIIGCWENGLNSQFALIHPQPGQVNELVHLVKFLQNTATLVKLTSNLAATLSESGSGKYLYFELYHLQRWTDVASFALMSMSQFTAMEKHQLYASILDTVLHLDSSSWFNFKFSAKVLSTFITFAGWPWLNEFGSQISQKLKPFPPFTRDSANLQFIKNSDLLMAKAISALRLELFRPWSPFVLAVYSSAMNATATFSNSSLLTELLSAISNVSWPLKKIPLEVTFLFLTRVLQTDVWKVEACVRSGIGDAITALPCICCHTVQNSIKLPGKQQQQRPLESGCRNCSIGKYQGPRLLLELKTQYTEKIVALASPILQSTFLSVKFRLIELISRCNNHMKNPSAVVVMSLVTVAVKGKAILSEEIFKKIGQILAEGNNTSLETGCPLKLEIAQRIFKVALPKVCHKLLQEKNQSKLNTCTRIKILLGIQELSTVGSISLSVFVEVMNFMLVILSQTSKKDMTVLLLCQTIVTNFAEMYKCSPHELITRVRSEISQNLVQIAIKQFYQSPEVDDAIGQCSCYIEMLKSIGSFSFRNTFAKYIYPTLMEQIVPKLHTNQCYRFLLSVLSRHANDSITIMLQETVVVWYPTLLLDHSVDTMSQCLKFLSQSYNFDAMFVAKQQDQRILNEALCRLDERREKLLRSLNHLCKWDESSSRQILSQGSSKAPLRSEIQELLDKRMLGFFLHLDTKVKSRIETVEMKKRILRSFVALINLMGKSKMTPLRSKAYQTLNSVTEQGPVFYDVMYEAWKAFAANLDNESFASMTCPILAAVLSFREIPSMQPNVDRFISHFVCFKKELTSVHHHKLYFLLDQCDDQEVNTAINKAVTVLKQQKWSDYFNMLVEEAGHSNSHIRYQAFRKLNDVFDKEAASVEKFVLAKGEQNVSRVISTLLAGLRGAAGGKPGEDKMQLAIANCFGNLGALDPFRFRNIDDDIHHNRSRRRTGLMLSTQLTAFCLFYVQELIREFKDAKDATIFDYCVCLIRNLFQDFNVQVNSKDPIWSNLSKENQEIITPMLNTKYVLDVKENLPNFSCPIYLSDHGKSFDEWLLNWLTVMIKCIKGSEKQASLLFVQNVYLLRKNARIAAFIIPFVALHAIFCADNQQLSAIIAEMKNILERWTILENLKAQNSMAIRDSEAEIDIFAEPMSVENESVFHFRCTQVIFSILDHLLRSLSLARRSAAAAARKANDRRLESQTPSSSTPLSEIMTPENMSKVDIVLKAIPQVLISQVAFDCQSSATALFYIELELKHSPSNEKLQKHLDYLQRIYVSLNDMDSVLGISAVRDTEPSSHERVLENIAEAKVEDYLKNIEQMAEQDPSNLAVNYALVQAYLSVDESKKAQNIICAILAKQPEWEVAFQDVQMESLIKLKSWDNLKSEVERLESFSGNPVMDDKSLIWNIAVSQTISKLHSHQFDKADEIVYILRERLVAPLVAASEEMHPYKRAYEHIVQLHILAELEDVIEIMRKHTIKNTSSRESINQTELLQDLKNMVATWDSRLVNVSKSRKILDQILNVRKSVFEILKATFQTPGHLSEVLNSSIRECWLDIAKDASKCANFIRADKALSEAKKFMSPNVLIVEAKILARKGNKESAVSVLQKGIIRYFPSKHLWKQNNLQHCANPQVLESRMVCSKALLLLAKLCEEQKLLDKQDYIDKYKEATDVYKDSEKNFFTLGSYFDRLWSKEKDNCDLQVKICIFYSRSLLYGCKYVYQSLPRLLSIWFDHAASVSKGEVPAPGFRIQGNYSNASSYSPTLITPDEALRNMEASINIIVNNVPPYVLMTAFSQLISRLCHSHTPTWAILKNIIVSLIKSHPYQTLWMTMAVNNSVNQSRRRRCLEVYKCVEKERPDLKNTVKDYCTLTEKLIILCDKQVSKEHHKISLGKIFDKLPKLIRGLGKVLIPFQIFMNYSLPQKGFSHKEHDPYPETPVYISDIDDNIDLMSSLIRPKKLTLIASNGKRYGMLCKPKDDLRKDSKVMEVNNVVNWYLRQNAECSSRRLHVRAYSVVALNEECGLLEWVPNLQTKRILLNKLYRENNIITPRTGVHVIPKHDPLEEKIKKFQDRYLKLLPPVFSQWFFNNFDDHQSWYVARMSYTRTAAVMSIVGYVMGLGDRHGENLLMDTVTGEVVHVDFNCLFNKGESFEYSEKVPFRLTQNMVDAMGSLKYEGVFRRSCEITMNMFRTHQNVFVSVFRPFVYDPLVEWQKYTRGVTASLVSGEMTNEQAVDTMNYIRCRLNGTGRVLMKEIDMELSVEAQVKFLIEEATSLTNLCQMYYGWAAHM